MIWPVSGSPISAIVDALDALDIDALVSQLAPDASLLRTDGRSADGVDEVRTALVEFVSELYGTTHTVSDEWHPEDGVWIAEMEAIYEMKNGVRHGPYKRAVVVRTDARGITQLRFYGSHELPLTAEHPYREVRAGTHWLPTL